MLALQTRVVSFMDIHVEASQLNATQLHNGAAAQCRNINIKECEKLSQSVRKPKVA